MVSYVKCVCSYCDSEFDKSLGHYNEFIKKGYNKHYCSNNCKCNDIEINKTHGMTGSRFHNIWKGIKTRCFNSNREEYKYYGAKGISVCEDWLSFENFYEDMYESYINHINMYGEINTTIERKNNKDNYYKNNCIWATKKQQRINQKLRDNQKLFKAISPEGKEYQSYSIRAFSKEHKLDNSSVSLCLRNIHKHHKSWKFEYL